MAIMRKQPMSSAEQPQCEDLYFADWLPYAAAPAMLAFAMGSRDQNSLVSLLGKDELVIIFDHLAAHRARVHTNNQNHLTLALKSYQYMMDRSTLQETGGGVLFSWAALPSRKQQRQEWFQEPRGHLDLPQWEAAAHTGALMHALSIVFELPYPRALPIERFRVNQKYNQQTRMMKIVLDAMLFRGVRIKFKTSGTWGVDVRGTIAHTLGIDVLSRIGRTAMYAWQTLEYTYLYASGKFHGREQELRTILGPRVTWALVTTSGMDQTMLAEQRMLDLDTTADMLCVRFQYTAPLTDSPLKQSRLF